MQKRPDLFCAFCPRVFMLEVRQLSIRYPNGVHALRDIDLSLPEGKIYGILGPSGAGKSSLLKGMLGLVRSPGTTRFRSRSLRDFRKEVAYVEQRENLDKDFPLSALDCVLLGTYPRLKWYQRPTPDDRKRALHALEDVGLARVKDRQIGALSGGQFQRVLIARALVQEPTLLFLDEPFVGLDVDNEAAVMRLLRAARDRGTTILIVHHDLSKVRAYFDEVILVNESLVAHGPTDTTFTREAITRTFELPAMADTDAQEHAPASSGVRRDGHQPVYP